ncbi:NADH:ubiquinone oxidoreductase subunit 2 [Longilinea arvoryzae]|uniref:NADH:ubiquinone oxidoreductase subunit 2 n=1 Tax=Longilinea arvoryzae TaxID=360412 RepID=A0A0S7BGN0_9CHLR|nr:proton-conducting transporter membrane subunit [Longilinea arvoryzae]GAP14196.1 NADH:ubiquinone oxidoreductase subunit 2 [Longilinea arvoryzae]
MNTVILWIFVPLGASIVLLIFNWHTNITRWTAAILALALAAAAALTTFGGLVQIGGRAYELTSSLSILGRQLMLDNSDRILLVLIYSLGAFWFLGTPAAGTHRLFTPLGLAIIALLVASLAVQPFLYAALLVEISVLMSIPMLAPPGKPAGQGVMRYLIFQTLGMPCILLGGWALGAIETNPANENLLIAASLLLALGVAFWLAVFPFYTWVPLLAGESHPYVAGFLFTLLPTVVFSLLLSFLDGYAFIRNSTFLFQGLQLAGTIMVATAGIWSAFQRDLTRLFGYTAILETGFALLALSLRSETGLEYYAGAFFPRLIGLGLWALALSVLGSHGLSLKFEEEKQAFQRLPIASTACAVAIFSSGGLPLLAGFPIRQPLLAELGSKSIPMAIWALVGCAGLMFGGFRYLNALFRHEPKTVHIEENRYQIVLLVTGVALLVVAGVFPRPFISWMVNILQGYANLF